MKTKCVNTADSLLYENNNTQALFDYMSSRYELLYHYLSLGIDKKWREEICSVLIPFAPKNIIDSCCGTAKLSIKIFEEVNNCNLIAVDNSEKMIELAKANIEKANCENSISTRYYDSQNLPFSDNQFDAGVMSFGARVMKDWEKGISELYRIAKPGAVVVILEFSFLPTFLVKHFYNFYYGAILPIINRLFNNNRTEYELFPNNILNFPRGKNFVKYLNSLEFRDIKRKRLTLGICNIYTAIK